MEKRNDMNSNLGIPKKLAMINDLTGYGRCSLAVAIPIVSTMGVQACPAPTSIFSNHMAFPTFPCMLCSLCPSLTSFYGLKYVIHIATAEKL